MIDATKRFPCNCGLVCSTIGKLCTLSIIKPPDRPLATFFLLDSIHLSKSLFPWISYNLIVRYMYISYSFESMLAPQINSDQFNRGLRSQGVGGVVFFRNLWFGLLVRVAAGLPNLLRSPRLISVSVTFPWDSLSMTWEGDQETIALPTSTIALEFIKSRRTASRRAESVLCPTKGSKTRGFPTRDFSQISVHTPSRTRKGIGQRLNRLDNSI
jgi:hypothetical protein